MRELRYPPDERIGKPYREGPLRFFAGPMLRFGLLSLPKTHSKHSKRRRRKGIRYGWIAILLLLEVIAEQLLPFHTSRVVHAVFLVKGVAQSLAVAVLAILAGRMASRHWYSLALLGFLNATLTLAAGMALGPDQFVDFLQGLYPQSTQVERIHRRHD